MSLKKDQYKELACSFWRSAVVKKDSWSPQDKAQVYNPAFLSNFTSNSCPDCFFCESQSESLEQPQSVSLHVFHTIAQADSGRSNHSQMIQSRLPRCQIKCNCMFLCTPGVMLSDAPHGNPVIEPLSGLWWVSWGPRCSQTERKTLPERKTLVTDLLFSSHRFNSFAIQKGKWAKECSLVKKTEQLRIESGGGGQLKLFQILNITTYKK